MNRVRYIISAMFLIASFITPAFGFFEYNDKDGNHIAFRVVPNPETSGEEDRRLLVSTFNHMYKDYKPSDLGDQFQTHDDVSRFLVTYFEESWKHLEDPSNKLIHLEKAGQLIGVAMVEFMDDKDATLHLRHFAIIPSEQRHGYGTVFMNALKQFPSLQVNRIIADTHVLYTETRKFYCKTGFKECKPHEEELRGSDKYLGLEWESWGYTLGQHQDLLDEVQYRMIQSQIKAFREGKLPKIVSPEIKEIPIEESGEGLVDVRAIDHSIIQMLAEPIKPLESPNHNSGWADNSKMRKTVYGKLEALASELDKLSLCFGYKPDQIDIRVFEGLRSLEIQGALFGVKEEEIAELILKEEQKANPHVPVEEIRGSAAFQAKVYEETCKWISPVKDNVPVHSTGAAVDIRLFDEGARDFVDLGKFGAIWGANHSAPTFSEQITYQQKRNRLFLILAAIRAGLTNYPYEFWHFSSGDRYASFWNEPDPLKRKASYGSVK